MERPTSNNRDISGNQFGAGPSIYQGDVHHHYHATPETPQIAPPAAIQLVRTIPYPPNEDFVDRPGILDELEKALSSTTSVQNAAVWGPGGSGKTQIALRSAYRLCQETPDCSVFWVHANDQQSFLNSYQGLSRELSPNNTLQGRELLLAVRDRIEKLPRWLFIVDNADDLNLFVPIDQGVLCQSLIEYIPRTSSGEGKILWTTCDRRIVGTLVPLRRGVHVSSMNPDLEAIPLFRKLIELPHLDQGDSKEKQISQATEESQLRDLVCKLKGNPLAIVQFAAALRRTSTSLKDGMSGLKKENVYWTPLEEDNGYDPHRPPGRSNSILGTLAQTMGRLQNSNPLAYRILAVISHLGLSIPYKLMVLAGQGLVQQHPAQGQNMVLTPSQFARAITRLEDLSLVRLRKVKVEEGLGDQRETLYGTNELVTRAMRYSLRGGPQFSNNSSGAYYARQALHVMDCLNPDDLNGAFDSYFEHMNPWYDHSMEVLIWAQPCGREAIGCSIITKLIQFLSSRADFARVKALGYWDLKMRINRLPQNDVTVLDSMINIADYCLDVGDFQEAESLSIQVQNIAKQNLQVLNYQNIRSKLRQAKAQQIQSQHASSYALAQQSSADLDLIPGGPLPEKISAMCIMAGCHQQNAQYREAEQLFTEARDTAEKVWGRYNYITITAKRELKNILVAQRRYEEAIAISIEVLSSALTLWGTRSWHTLKCVCDFAEALDGLKQYEEAKSYLQLACREFDRRLGPSHLETLRADTSLACTLLSLGETEEAVRLMDQSREGMRRSLAPDHPWMLRVVDRWEKRRSEHVETKEETKDLW